MSWLFSQALVEEYLEASSLDGEQSAPLNGKPTQQAYCAPDKMTDFSRLSRFGMTFKPLTERPWKGIVDVVSGGFPCQDISIAGNGDGLDGERSGMWREMARIIGEVRPQYAFVENSPMLITRGLERVLADLTAMGYDSKWGVISAADIGAKHKRERIWIVASSNTHKQYRRGKSQQPKHFSGKKIHHEFGGICSIAPNKANVGNAQSPRLAPRFEGQGQGESWRASIGSAQWWQIEPPVDRVVDGMVDRVDRLKAIGNGQVPLCAATAWRILSE
jgi:DNA (cytosine-5)-methyltransferase 1